MDQPAKVEWYEVRTQDEQRVLIMVCENPGGESTAVPCEVSMVRSSLSASGDTPTAAMRSLQGLLAGKTRQEIFGGTS